MEDITVRYSSSSCSETMIKSRDGRIYLIKIIVQKSWLIRFRNHSFFKTMYSISQYYRITHSK